MSIMAGCTYDFDQFDGTVSTQDMSTSDAMMRPDGAMPDDATMTDLDTPDGMVLVGDMPSDLGMDMTTPQGAMTGEDCGEDSACVSGLCLEGVCVQECDATQPCGTGERCQEIDEVRAACLPVCEAEGDVCALGDRQDLKCVRAITYDAEPPNSSIRTFLSCAPDADADSVADAEDNCPMQANARQLDIDADGIGDACEEPGQTLCVEGLTAGRRTLAGIPWDLTGVDATDMVDGSWLMLQGGKDDQGAPVAKRVMLDRLTWSYDAVPDNLYAAHDMASVTMKDGRLLVMPGAAEPGGRQVGRILTMDRDGQVKQGAALTTTVHGPVMGTTRDGVVVMAGYIDPPETTVTPRAGVWRYDPSRESFVNMHAATTQKRVKLSIGRRAAGGVRVYTGADTNELTPGGPQISRAWLFSVRGNYENTEQIPLPGGSTALSPIYLETPGGFELVVDRVNGASYRIERNPPALLSLQEFPAYNITLDVLRGDFVVSPGHLGLMLVGEDTAGDGTLKITEYNFLCTEPLGEPGSPDRDGDGVDDRVDNCITQANPEQEDADGDSQGDLCDEDDDDDGITDMLDTVPDIDGMMMVSRALDTDNDGLPNSDDPDDDNDGVPDERDRLPLDTDNDGLPNRSDTDDDNDGVADGTERAAGTDPHHPLDYPNVGRISFVLAPQQGDRQVVWGKIAAIDEVQTVAFPVDTTPHTPRFSQTGRSIVALDGVAGEATDVLWSLIESPSQMVFTPRTESFALDMGKLKAVNVTTIDDMLEGERPLFFYVVHERDGVQARWDMSRVNAAVVPDMRREEELLRGDYALIEDMYLSAGRLYFIGAPTMCDACESVYSMTPNAGAAPRSELERIYGNLLGITRTGGNTLVTVRQNEVFYGGEQVELPAQIVEVNSAVALGGTWQMVISARTMDGSYDLWHFDGRTGKWLQLTREADDVIELDWKP